MQLLLKPHLCILFLFLSLLSCKQKEQDIQRSFYYWQTEFELSDDARNTLTELGVNRLYVKFFDVKWEASAAQPVPVAKVNFSEPVPEGIEVVPVIFITNESLQKINSSDISTLAFKISKLIDDLIQLYNLDLPKEIQLDGDWTGTTRDNYFLLISEMKKFPLWKDVQWSATIRLHQIKFREQTSVPPVDRGMLMFYNMGTIDSLNAGNSIYDEQVAAQYLERVNEYPLPLDAGIACFSWGLLFENDELQRIFYPLYPAGLNDTLFDQTAPNLYTANRDFYFEGQYLVKGNIIKLETMTPQLSVRSAELLNGHLKNESRSVILYHLDPVILNQYSNEEFETLYSAFN